MTHLFLCILAALAICFYMVIGSSSKRIITYEWLSTGGLTMLLTGLLVLIVLGVGFFWIITVIRTDKRLMYSALGSHDANVEFNEFNELNVIYMDKLNELRNLKNNYNEKKLSLTASDMAVKQIFYQYKNANEKTQMLESDLNHLKEIGRAHV